MNKIIFIFLLILSTVCLFSPHKSFSQGIKNSSIEEVVTELEKEVLDLEKQTIEKRQGQVANKNIEVLEIKNMEMMDVFKLIEAKSDIHIISDEIFSGLVNISLKDVDAFDALRIILEPKGLAYELISSSTASVMAQDVFQLRNGKSFIDEIQMKQIILKHGHADDVKEILNQVKSSSARIVTNSEQNALFCIGTPSLLNWLEEFIQKIDVAVETKIIVLQHKNADDVMKERQHLLTEYVGRMIRDPEKNAVIITDTPEKLEYLEPLIKESDAEEKNIQLEVRVVQILLNDEHQQGIDWKAILSGYESMDYKDFWQDETLSVLKWGIVSNEDSPVLLEALDAVGAMRTIFDEQQEVLKGENFPFVIHPQETIDLSQEEEKSSFKSSSGFQIVLNYVKTEGKEITLNFQPHIDKLSQFPEIKIPQDSTLVIGGFFFDTEVESVKKFPFLSSIPFLGSAFQSQRKDVQKSEIIIFVTPTFISVNKD